MPKLDVLEDWISALRKRVETELKQGRDVPGYKLVPTRPTRKWADPAGAEAWVLSETKLVESDIYAPREFRSVAQIEKAMGKARFKKSPLADIVVKESSGVKVVPDSDPTPAISVTAGSEFLALPAGTDTQDTQ